jgi:hypothetical protein
LGHGKIEIFTKPGSDKYHGTAKWNFGNEFCNTRNPYSPDKVHFLVNEFEGSGDGPLTKKSSFTLDAQRNIVDNGVFRPSGSSEGPDQPKPPRHQVLLVHNFAPYAKRTTCDRNPQQFKFRLEQKPAKSWPTTSRRYIRETHPMIQIETAHISQRRQRSDLPTEMPIYNQAVSSVSTRRGHMSLLLTVLLVAGCTREGRLEENAQQLGGIELDLRIVNFAYLKSKLATLPMALADCRKLNVHYANCQKATWGSGSIAWGSGSIVTALFNSEAGYFAAKKPTESQAVYTLDVNSHFKGTLCGDRIDKVIASGRACGMPVTTTDTNEWGRTVRWSPPESGGTGPSRCGDAPPTKLKGKLCFPSAYTHT